VAVRVIIGLFEVKPKCSSVNNNNIYYCLF
jgi:hypothetical protein